MKPISTTTDIVTCTLNSYAHRNSMLAEYSSEQLVSLCVCYNEHSTAVHLVESTSGQKCLVNFRII